MGHIKPVLHVLSSEIATARQLIVGFEKAIEEMEIQWKGHGTQIQGLDLALQILNDVQHLTELLDRRLPSENVGKDPLCVSGVRLERIRKRLGQNENQMPELNQSKSASSVDLF